MIDLMATVNAEAFARLWFCDLYPGERTPFITGRLT